MLLLNIIFLSLVSYASAKAAEPQTPIAEIRAKPSDISTKRHVAIIGAGIAGATAAYFLHDYLRTRNPPVEITIYESQPQIGGRTSSVSYRYRTVEGGAQYWSKSDWCMKMVMSEVVLKPREKE